MAAMMFPDTSNDRQRAALRYAAERAGAAVSLSVKPVEGDERLRRNAVPAMREAFSVNGAHALARYVAVHEGRGCAAH
jgi:hypothetical protein